jgi:hypothetical protein
MVESHRLTVGRLAGVLDREAGAEERGTVGPVGDVVLETVQGLRVSIVR